MKTENSIGSNLGNNNAVVASSIIQLRKMPDVAPRGQQSGFFSAIQAESGKDALGQDCNYLKVVVDLATKDAKGQSYRVEKKYNLSGRGVTAFQDDYKSWSGLSLTDEELDSFNSDVLMKDKPVTVEIKHRKEGKKLIPAIENFLPAPQAVEALKQD